MHELGLVFHTIDILEDVAREQEIHHISKVTLELGEVSGAVTEFFQDAWRWAADKKELLNGAELEILSIEAITKCNACGKTYPTVRYGITCPHCGSRDTYLLQGQEMNIASIECE